AAADAAAAKQTAARAQQAAGQAQGAADAAAGLAAKKAAELAAGPVTAHPRTSQALASATCASTDVCGTATSGMTGDHSAQVAAECAGADCATRTIGKAVYDGNNATADTTCTVTGADGQCAGTTQVGASDVAAQAAAACAGSDGSECSHRIAAESKQTSRTAGNKATAEASCGSDGGAGDGWCQTTAVAETTATQAMAAGGCQGSAGTGCRFSYEAQSKDKAGKAAKAEASGEGKGKTGAGQVITSAMAVAGKGQAQAQAQAACTGTAGVSCQHEFAASVKTKASGGGATAKAKADAAGSGGEGGGAAVAVAGAVAGNGQAVAQAQASCTATAGVTCRRSYDASVTANAGGGGSWAKASAAGSGRGGEGVGGVNVAAAALAGNGQAQAQASCQGTAGVQCAHRYEAGAADSASAAGASANASAHGSGGGGEGSGYVSVMAQASAGPGSANAAASCSGSAGVRCRHSYEASASASARDPQSGSFARANAHGSGGGGVGGGGVGVSAYAYAQGNHAGAGASCSGAANCSASYFAEAHDSAREWVDPTYTTAGGRYDANKWARCSGSGNGGCGVTAVAVPRDPDGGEAYCTGNCANFAQGGRGGVFTVTVPSIKDQMITAGVIGPDGEPIDQSLGTNVRGGKATCEQRNCTLTTREFTGQGEPKERSCVAPCSLEGDSGQRITVDEHGKITVTNPTTPGGTRHDVATDSRGASLYADDRGRREGWVAGDGSLTDGHGGSTIIYKAGPSDGSGNTASFADANGGRFQTTCQNGCSGTLKAGDKIDTFDISGHDVQIVGRTPQGDPGRIQWNGEGLFTTAEGAKIVANGDGPSTPTGFGNYVNLLTPGYRDGQIVQQGRYEITGQTGSITFADGRRISNEGEVDWGRPGQIMLNPGGSYGYSGPSSIQLGEDIPNRGVEASWRVTATTPYSDGKGGSFGCTGMCTETVPGNRGVDTGACTVACTYRGPQLVPGGYSGPLPTDEPVDATVRTCSAVCTMHDEFAGNRNTKTPNGYFSVEMLGYGDVRSFTPQGDAQYCTGKGCSFTQGYRDANGNGGFAVCHVPGSGTGGCAGETVKPDGGHRTLVCETAVLCEPVVLLYPNRTDIDKYGANDGWACGEGITTVCTSNEPSKQLIGRGELDPGYLSLIDPTFVRPSMGTPVDKELAEALAPFGVKEGDPLPPLDPKQYAALTTEQKAAYDAALPQLSPAERDFASARFTNADADNRSDSRWAVDNADAVTAAANRVAAAQADGTFTEQRFADDLALLTKAAYRSQRLDVNVAISGGLTSMQYQRPFIDTDNRAVGEDPGLPADAGAGSLLAANEKLQKALGVDAKGRPVDAAGKVIVSSPLERQQAIDDGLPFVELSPEQKVQADADRLAGYAATGHRTALLPQRMALDDDIAAAMAAHPDGLPKPLYDQLVARDEALTAEAGRIVAMQGSLQERAKALPFSTPDGAALRQFDLAFAGAADETQLAGRLSRLDRFQADMTALAEARTGEAGADDPLAIQLGVIANGAGAAYGAVSEDFGFRTADSALLWHPKGIETVVRYPLALPSTGRADTVYVLNSAINTPGYREYPGEVGNLFRGQEAQDADVIADWASQATAAQTERDLARIRTVDPAQIESLLNGMNEGDEEKTNKALEALEDIGGGDFGTVEAGEKGEVGAITVFVQDPEHPEKGYPGQLVLFRVRGDDGRIRYVDAEGATYDSLKDYQQNNSLADDQNLLLPVDLGSAVDAPGSLRQVDGHEDPGWKTGLKWTGRGLLVVGAGLLIASGVGAPVGVTVGGATLGAGTLGTAALVGSGVAFGTSAGLELHQRSQHNQSIGLSDPTARSLWITVGASALVGSGSLLSKAGALKVAAGAPRAAAVAKTGTVLQTAGGVAFAGQFAHSTYTQIANWESLTPAQRDEFWIDTSIGALTFVSGGAHAAGRAVAAQRVKAWGPGFNGLNQRIGQITVDNGGRPSVAGLAGQLGVSRANVRFALRAGEAAALRPHLGAATNGARPSVAELSRATGAPPGAVRAALRDLGLVRPAPARGADPATPRVGPDPVAMGGRDAVPVAEFTGRLRGMSPLQKAMVVEQIKNGELGGLRFEMRPVDGRPVGHIVAEGAPAAGTRPAPAVRITMGAAANRGPAAALRKEIAEGQQRLQEAGRKGEPLPQDVLQRTREAHQKLDAEAARWSPEEQARSSHQRNTDRLMTEYGYNIAASKAGEKAGTVFDTPVPPKQPMTLRMKVASKARAWGVWVGMSLAVILPTVGADGLLAMARNERPPAAVAVVAEGGARGPVAEAVSAAMAERGA
ncbi:DUF4781 domain-containing protein, partial [Pseudonocardia lacus]|uniref:DUF4781 domain-containing protein n=1 Tax=Pseudonocardia lacus TaxID=2835865 RepID=UPI001BDD2478